MISDKQQFIHFLKENNIYEQYMYNFNKREESRNKAFPKNQYFSKVRRGQYINYAFTWSKTIEGWSYWHKFHEKWINYPTAIKL